MLITQVAKRLASTVAASAVGSDGRLGYDRRSLGAASSAQCSPDLDVGLRRVAARPGRHLHADTGVLTGPPSRAGDAALDMGKAQPHDAAYPCGAVDFPPDLET